MLDRYVGLARASPECAAGVSAASVVRASARARSINAIMALMSSPKYASAWAAFASIMFAPKTVSNRAA